MRFLIAFVTFSALLAMAFASQVGGGACSSDSQCLGGGLYKDNRGADVTSGAQCINGVCVNGQGSYGTHYQCRQASGDACPAALGTPCTLQWSAVAPNCAPTANANGVCNDCPGDGLCSGHGLCQANLTCQCQGGWSGADCSVPPGPTPCQYGAEQVCGPYGNCVGAAPGVAGFCQCHTNCSCANNVCTCGQWKDSNGSACSTFVPF